MLTKVRTSRIILKKTCSYPLMAALFLLGVSTSSCHQGTNKPEDVIPSCLIVASGAINVKRTRFNGRNQLLYTVKAEYPADALLSDIKSQLDQQGWKPLKEDFLNPGLPSSHERGWQFFLDDTTNPKTSVRSWDADWENATHDIVVYSFVYRCPGDACASTLNLHDLQVIGIYIPAALAKQMKGAVPVGSPKP